MTWCRVGFSSPDMISDMRRPFPLWG